jgi:zinc/manganese transport system substrate-binding protein
MSSNLQWISLVIGLTLWAGCDRDAPPARPAPAAVKIPVLATIPPLADMVQRIGGDAVQVEWVVDAGQRPEDVEPTAALRQRADRAKLVVTSGPWDRWASASLSDEARAARLVQPERMAAARDAEPQAYLWLDPAVARELAEAVREKLTLLDSTREAQFRAGAAAYVAELDAVAREWGAKRPAAGQKVLAARPVWGAFCRGHGLVQVAPVAGPEEKLSAGDFKALAAAAKEAKVGTVVVDAATQAAVRLRIEERTGLRAVTLDAVGTSAPDGRNTLPRVLRYDLEQVGKLPGG